MMKNWYSQKMTHIGRNKGAVIAAVLLLMITIAAFGFKKTYSSDYGYTDIPKPIVKKDSLVSVQAFQKVYTVLMSPRCVNCHPIGDVPLQGDDSHIHHMFPKRGEDGKGLYAMKCANCHQPENTSGPHAPPGSPDWHLPPANMKMVFEGKSAHELAKQLVDRKQNGNKSMKQLLEHADDELVLAGWKPAEGHSMPPMSHSEFKKAWITWIKNGAYAPAKQ